MKCTMLTQLLLCLFLTAGYAQSPCTNCDFSAPCTMSMFDLPLCAPDFGDQDKRKPFPFKESILTSTVNFIVSSSMMNNLGLSEMVFDLDDGFGLRTCFPGQEIMTTYAAPGVKEIFWQKCGGGPPDRCKQ